MIFKQINSDRSREMDMIDSIAFTYPLADPQAHDNATNADEQERISKRFAMEDESTGRLMGGMILTDYQTRIGNRWLPLSGVGGVSTLPEYRRKGVIRGIFNNVLPCMYDNGYVLSGLYPFSHAFYRKFGYEVTSGIHVCSVGLKQLSAFQMPDEIRSIDNPRDELSARAIYELFSQKRDISMRRELSECWKEVLGGDIYKDRAYKYLLLRREGDDIKPCAYITFTPEKENGIGNIMAAREAAFVDSDALLRILGFASTFYPHYQRLRVTLPGDVDLGAICTDPYDVKVTIEYNYMLRAVNAREMLLSQPISPALHALCEVKPLEFSILLHDSMIPQNEGKYDVRITSSGITCEKAALGDADMEMNITTFTQLTTGTIALAEACSRAGFRMNAPCPAAQMLFIRRPQYIVDHY